MEETIRALQIGTSCLDFGDNDWNLFPGMLLPPKIKIPDFKRYDGTSDPRHHLHLIEAGKKLDMGVKLGRIEGPSKKKDGETPKKQTIGTARRNKDTTIGNPYQSQQAYPLTPPIVIQSQTPQQYAPTQVQQGRPPASRSPQPAQRAPTLRTQQGNTAQLRLRKQYTNLPTPSSHIFRQLLVGNKIKTEAPGPYFDPAVQNQNLH
ncbi:hypothetical protein CRG98_002348, partial [Punica granatum]